MDLYSASSWNL